MPLLPLIGSLLQGVANVGTSIYNTDRTIQAQKELARYQYSKDMQMYNLANEYNSPVKQMERLREANLNPSLLSGSPANTTQAIMPKYNAPDIKYNYDLNLRIPETLSQFQNLVNSRTEGNILKARERNEQAQADISEINRDAISFQGFQNIALGRMSETDYKHWNSVLKAHEEYLMRKYGYELRKTQLSVSEQDLREKQIYNSWLDNGITKTDRMLWRLLLRNTDKSKINFPKFGEGKIGTAHGMYFNY